MGTSVDLWFRWSFVCKVVWRPKWKSPSATDEPVNRSFDEMCSPSILPILSSLSDTDLHRKAKTQIKDSLPPLSSLCYTLEPLGGRSPLFQRKLWSISLLDLKEWKWHLLKILQRLVLVWGFSIFSHVSCLDSGLSCYFCKFTEPLSKSRVSSAIPCTKIQRNRVEVIRISLKVTCRFSSHTEYCTFSYTNS